ARDTAAFLYSFSNALSLQGIYIQKVTIENFGSRVRDILYISNARGEKIIEKEDQEALKISTVLTKQFTHFLAWSPDPGRSLRYFEQFLELILEKKTAASLIPLVNRKETLDLLARLLGTSEFLWEDFLRLRFENLFPLLRDFKKTPMTVPRETLRKNLAALLKKAGTYEDKKEAINDFKDREMFRIDLKHLRDRPEQLSRFSKALSDLADIVLEETGQVCCQELVKTYGRPLLETGKVCPFSIFGLGKYGGREMGFASDIELIVVFGGEGETDGPNRIGNGEFFERLTREILAFVTARREGIFHIDLRLRPYGEKGTLASPFDFIRSYYSPGGGAAPFERQALTKLRWVAGDRTLGKKVEQFRNRFAFSGEPWDIPAALELRGRQIRELIKPGAVNVKISPGGVIDIEYAVQYLQLLHGHEYSDLRTPSTLKALEALRKRKFISQKDSGKIRKAYIFLRALIDALRMVRGNARDLILPDKDSDDFKFLARRMGYFGAEWNREAADLKKEIGQEMEVAHRFFISHFGTY
ncbi:MAG TPA: glutamine synthetase adenylyltransferase, partial [Nitrospiria bacterium]|nr:glutamine synthetase adenylyltransferase [Nitrospiria bacterium]